MSLNTWGEEKQAEMLALWRRHFEDHRPGFELFTSPLRDDASVVIIGYNAGDGDEAGNEDHHHMEPFLRDPPEYGLPERGQYEPGGKTYDVASRMRRYLFDGKHHLLSNAVETNRYYLRTPRKPHHTSLLNGKSLEAQEDYEAFCRKTTREVIQKTAPEAILDFSGETTAVEFCEDLGFPAEFTSSEQISPPGKLEASVSVSTLTEPPHSTVISIAPHPSYPPIAMEHLEFWKETVPTLLPE